MYALGALAWHLLTTTSRRAAPLRLPSEVSPGLAAWDTFIDGCCRTNPERRFESVDAALRALPSESAQRASAIQAERAGSTAESPRKGTGSPGPLSTEGAKPTDPTAPGRRAFPRRLKAVLLGIAAVLALAVYLRREQIASMLPFTEGMLASYERGFGDTVLTYEDRSYEGSSWTLLKEADSLSTIASLGRYYTLSGLTQVTGWDDDNFWLLDEEGPLYQYKGGHWHYRADLDEDDYCAMRLLDADTVLCSSYFEGSIYRVSPQGAMELERKGEIRTIAPISRDLYYFMEGVKSYPSCAKFADGTTTWLSPDKHKEAFVHKRNNTPLKECLVGEIRHTETLSPGDAVGVTYLPVRIVRFENGIWYAAGDEIEELHYKSLYGVNEVWFGPDLSFAGFVGDDGLVLLDEMDGTRVGQSITKSEQSTSADLIAAWGVGPKKYWVMDKNGTVWERSEDRWRTVVRGMYLDDIEFNDAWVSPTGSVMAITHDAVYRLN